MVKRVDVRGKLHAKERGCGAILQLRNLVRAARSMEDGSISARLESGAPIDSEHSSAQRDISRSTLDYCSFHYSLKLRSSYSHPSKSTLSVPRSTPSKEGHT